MLNRRSFLASTAATAALSTAVQGFSTSANDKVVVAIMGANDRGSQLARQLVKIPAIEIAYICDPDERAIAKGITAATSQGARKPQGLKDFRQALDDPAVDAIICAAPNHWHTPATLIACDAGKHVYVEKPCSHTASEGALLAAAVEKSGKVVQVGMQRRSSPLYQQAIEKVRGGALGEAIYARSWYYRMRPSIGRSPESSPPSWLDFDLWQGPATSQPYRDNILHYNWHFFWHWGDAELGNNGVHTIDICRWALGVDLPNRVTAAGSRIRYDDDQQTPDTCVVSYDCDGKTIIWEGVSWSPPQDPTNAVGIEIRGEAGFMTINDSGYTIYDNSRQVVGSFQASRGDAEHLLNFVSAIRDGSKPHADVYEGHKSAMFCHLGNISYRLAQSLDIDPITGKIRSNPTGDELWTARYRDGWLPKV